MDNNNERCAVCGDLFTGDDVKIYCPDCGLPMHKDCFEIEGRCPNQINHIIYSGKIHTNDDKPSARHERFFPDGEGCEICGKPFAENDDKVFCPECGTAMHRVCYNMTHTCPYSDEHEHTASKVTGESAQSPDSFDGCDICGKAFSESEEKVYCPVCGTPVHKACWQQTRRCPNEKRHSTGYDWEKVHSAKTTVQDKTVRRSLTQGGNVTDGGEMNGSIPGAIEYDKFTDVILDHPMTVPGSDEELTCRGVKQSELLYFLGLHNFSTPRFFLKFMDMANDGKVVSLNLSAWIFAPFYHFYRRMTGPGIVLTLATFVLMVPTMIYEMIYWSTSGQNEISRTISSAAAISSYVLQLIRIALLLFNDYIYMRWSVSKILTLREKYKDASEEEYHIALENSGNPKMLYVLGGISLLFLLVYLLSIFLRISGITNVQ